jgi:hypothetical protein
MRSLTRISFATAALAVAFGVPATADVTPASVSVSPNVQVNARTAGQLVEDYKSPAVAINPNDPNNLVAVFRHDSPDYGCLIYHSLDGGKSWAASPFPPPPKGTCWSPSVAFDGSNDVYVAAQNRPPGGGRQDIIVWKSTDGGKSFTFPGKNAAGQDGGPGFAGFQAGIAVDTHPASPHRGRIYLTWYNFPGFPASIQIYVAYSDDGGVTFSDPATAPVNGEFQVFPNPVVGPDGTLYIVYKDTFSCTAGQGAGAPAANSPSSCPIRVMRSSDGGQSLGGRFDVFTATYKDLSAGEQPGIAVTPAGELLVTFASLPPLGSPCPQELDAFVARSTDKGQTWSAPVRVNDDPCTNGASQRDPWVSVAPNGRVDAIFYDNRGDPGGRRYDVFYAHSSDSGQTFEPNTRVSDRSFDASRLFTPRSSGFQSNEFDQQNGIASTNAGAVGAWGDARNDPANSTDVFSARIALGSGPFSGDQGGSSPGTGGGPGSGPRGRVRPNLIRPGFARAVQTAGRSGSAVAELSRSSGKIVVRLRGKMIGNRGRPCGGRIKIGTRAGRRRVATRVGRMGRACRYSKRYTFATRRIPKRLRPRNRKLVLRITIRYQGNSQLKPDLSPAKRVKVRRQTRRRGSS